MKFLITIFSLLLLCLPVQAQISLQGLVTYQNTGDRISTVQINARGAAPTVTKATSDQKGVFQLTFPHLQAGAVITLGIQNRTYDIVNHPRELTFPLSEDPMFQFRLVLCKKGERDANAVTYYEISTKFIEAGFQQKLDQKNKHLSTLRQQLNQREKNEQDLYQQVTNLEDEIVELNRQHDLLLDQAWVLAEKFSRIDFAQADSLYRAAFHLFSEGKIEAARDLMNGEERQKNLKKLQALETEVKKEEAQIARMEEAIAQQKSVIEQKKVELDQAKSNEIRNYLLDADLAAIQFDLEGIEKNYLAALNLDTTNVEVFEKIVDLYQDLYRFGDAVAYGEKGLQLLDDRDSLSPIELDLKLELLASLGTIYTREFKDHRKGASALEAVLVLADTLMPYLPQSYLKQKYITLPRLIMIYSQMGQMEQALQANTSYKEVYRELLEKYPDSSLELTHRNFDLIFNLPSQSDSKDTTTGQAGAFGDFFSASGLKQLVPAYRELIKVDSSWTDLLVSLLVAGSRNLITSGNEDDVWSAIEWMAEGLNIRRAQATKNPRKYKPELAESLYLIGGNYALLQQLTPTLYPDIVVENKSIQPYFEEAETYYQQQLAQNPEVFGSKLSKVQMELFQLLKKDSLQQQQALYYLDQALLSYEQLYSANAKKYLPDYIEALVERSRFPLSPGQTDKTLNRAVELFYQIDTTGMDLIEMTMMTIELAKRCWENALAGNSRESAIELGLDCIARMEKILESIDVQLFPALAMRVQLMNFLKEELVTEQNRDPRLEQLGYFIDSLNEQYTIYTSIAGRLALTRQLLDTLEFTLERYPDHAGVLYQVALANGNYSWYLLLTGQFEAAETHARRGLQLDEAQTWINTNLAHSLLLQGEIKAARAIYTEFKGQAYTDDQTYTEVFLADFEALEEAGISSRHFDKIKQLLSEK